jgi:hypothetical protein
MPAFALIFMMLLGPLAKAASFSTMVDDLSLSELELTFSESKVAFVLGSSGKDLTKDEQRAAAVLVSAGILSPDDLLSACPRCQQVSTVSGSRKLARATI